MERSFLQYEMLITIMFILLWVFISIQILLPKNHIIIEMNFNEQSIYANE